MLEAVVEQLHQFARERERRLVGELARGVEGNARFGGVRDYEPHLGLLGQAQVGVEIGVRVNAAAHNVNQINAIDRFAAVKSLKIKIIKSLKNGEGFLLSVKMNVLFLVRVMAT